MSFLQQFIEWNDIDMLASLLEVYGYEDAAEEIEELGHDYSDEEFSELSAKTRRAVSKLMKRVEAAVNATSLKVGDPVWVLSDKDWDGDQESQLESTEFDDEEGDDFEVPEIAKEAIQQLHSMSAAGKYDTGGFATYVKGFAPYLEHEDPIASLGVLVELPPDHAVNHLSEKFGWEAGVLGGGLDYENYDPRQVIPLSEKPRGAIENYSTVEPKKNITIRDQVLEFMGRLGFEYDRSRDGYDIYLLGGNEEANIFDPDKGSGEGIITVWRYRYEWGKRKGKRNNSHHAREPNYKSFEEFAHAWRNGPPAVEWKESEREYSQAEIRKLDRDFRKRAEDFMLERGHRKLARQTLSDSSWLLSDGSIVHINWDLNVRNFGYPPGNEKVEVRSNNDRVVTRYTWTEFQREWNDGPPSLNSAESEAVEHVLQFIDTPSHKVNIDGDTWHLIEANTNTGAQYAAFKITPEGTVTERVEDTPTTYGWGGKSTSDLRFKYERHYSSVEEFTNAWANGPPFIRSFSGYHRIGGPTADAERRLRKR